MQASRCPGHNVRGIAVPSQERIGRSIAEHERDDATRAIPAREHNVGLSHAAPDRLSRDMAGSAHPIWALPPMDCGLGSCTLLGRQYEGCQASTASWPARHETNNAWHTMNPRVLCHGTAPRGDGALPALCVRCQRREPYGIQRVRPAHPAFLVEENTAHSPRRVVVRVLCGRFRSLSWGL